MNNVTNLPRDVHGDTLHKGRDGNGAAGSAQQCVARMYSKKQEVAISGRNSLSPNSTSASGDGGRIT